MDERSDAELVRAALAGSQGAYRTLVERFQGRLFGLIVRMVRDRALAEDLTQETFIKAFGALDSFDPRYKLQSWLFKIAHNTAIDHLRRSSLATVPLESGDPDAFDPVDFIEDLDAVDPHQTAERSDLARDLERSLGILDPIYRELLVLRHIEGLSYGDIAEVTGLPMGTVKTRLHRGRKQLAELLEERGWTP